MNSDDSESNEKTPTFEEKEGVKVKDKEDSCADNGEKIGLGSHAYTGESVTENERTSTVSYEVFSGEFHAEKIQLYLPSKASTSSDQVSL